MNVQNIDGEKTRVVFKKEYNQYKVVSPGLA